MRPRAGTQLSWGIASAVVVLAVILVPALVPDPFFRQRVYQTRLDDVASIDPGAPVYFRGAEVGSVRSVTLEPTRRTFAVALGLRRDWRPSACSFVQLDAGNPLAAPRIEVVAAETSAAGCPAAQAAAGCAALGAPAGTGLTGCRRAPDMAATALAAIDQLHALVTRVTAMMPAGGFGGGTGGVDFVRMAADTSAALAALSNVSGRIDQGFRPGKGDIALTLANVRQATGQASRFDIASLNDTVGEVRKLVAQNQAVIASLLEEGRGATADTRALLEQASASLAQTSDNLARASAGAAALTDRLSSDPTYALKGQRLADPPKPGATQ